MAFDYQGALNAGYTPDEINAYLQEKQIAPPPSVSQPPSGNFLGNLLSSIANPFIKTGANIAGGAYELGRAGDQAIGSPLAHAMGNSDDYINQQGQGIGNPFLSDQQLQQYHTNPMGQIGDQAKNSVAIASYAVPFGRGANILTKATLPGMAASGMQSVANPGATPGSVAGNTLLGGLLPTAFSGASSLLRGAQAVHGKANELAQENLNGLGRKFVQSQYQLPEALSEKYDLPSNIQHIVQTTGITNKREQLQLSQDVIDSLSDVVNNAVSKAGPVDVGGMYNFAKGVLAHGYEIPDTKKTAIMGIVKSAINNSMDNPDGNITGANPEKIMQTIRDFEKNGAAHALASKGGENVEEAQKAVAWGNIADELRNRLYLGPDGTTGANAALAKILAENPQISESIHAINPNIGILFDQAVAGGEKAPIVQQVRHIMAPYVNVLKAGNYSDNQSMHNVISPLEFFGTMGALGHNPLAALTVLGGQKAINSDTSKGLLGKLLMSAANVKAPTVPAPSAGTESRVNSALGHLLPTLQGGQGY